MTFLTLGFAGLRTMAGPPGAMHEYRVRPDRMDAFEATIEKLTEDYGAATRDVAYRDEETGEWVEMAGHAANINPAWEGGGGPKSDAGWTTVTDEYDPVNAEGAYAPLIAAIEERRVGSGAFGAFKLYRVGGEVHGDVFLPAMSFTLNLGGTDAEYVPGIQTGYSHYADQNIYAEPIVLDPRTGAVYRHLADKRKRRHVKPRGQTTGKTAREVAEWWDKELDRLKYMGDALVHTVQDARNYIVEFEGTPFGPVDFYTALGFPASLAKEAGGSSRMAPHAQSAWALFQSITHVLADYGGKLDGRAIRGHFRRANDILFRPPHAEEEVLDVWRQRDEADQTDIHGTPMRSVLLARKSDLAGAAAEYRSLKDRLKELAEAADEVEA